MTGRNDGNEQEKMFRWALETVFRENFADIVWKVLFDGIRIKGHSVLGCGRALAKRLSVEPDFVHDVLTLACEKFSQTYQRRTGPSPKPFLAGIVAFTALDQARAVARRTRLQDVFVDDAHERASVLALVSDVDDKELDPVDIARAADALPERLKQTLALAAQGLTDAVIAERLGIKEVTVRVRKHRAFESLKELLERQVDLVDKRQGKPHHRPRARGRKRARRR